MFSLGDGGPATRKKSGNEPETRDLFEQIGRLNMELDWLKKTPALCLTKKRILIGNLIERFRRGGMHCLAAPVFCPKFGVRLKEGPSTSCLSRKDYRSGSLIVQPDSLKSA